MQPSAAIVAHDLSLDISRLRCPMKANVLVTGLCILPKPVSMVILGRVRLSWRNHVRHFPRR